VGQTNATIRAINQKYKEVYNKELEKAIMGDLGGKLGRLFVALLQVKEFLLLFYFYFYFLSLLFLNESLYCI